MTTHPQSRRLRPDPAAGMAWGPWNGDDIAALFGRLPAVFALLSGPCHVLEIGNPAFFQAVGTQRTRTGEPIGSLMPELAEQGFLDLLDEVYITGRPFTASDTRIVLGKGAAAREAFFDFTYEPRRDEDGQVVGITVLGVETTDIKHSQKLAGEQRALLEQIASDAPLDQILDGMAKVIEALTPGVLVSVLLSEDDGAHLRHGAAPSLPDFYNQAIDGIATGEGVGSCGTAAHRRQPVIVADIATDPFWDDFRALADQAGLAACWSTPILAADEELLGTFAMYYRAPRAPQETDLALSAVFARTAALAIERHRIQEARTAAEVREKIARQDLAFVLEASTVIARELDYDAGLRHLARLAVPALAPLCAIDVFRDGRLCRIATAAAEETHQQLLICSTPLHPRDEVIARVLASGVTEIARRPSSSLAPWQELGAISHLCVPLSARGRTFGTLSLLTTIDYLDGHAIALADELARRAAVHADNARQYTERARLACDLQAGLLLAELPALPGLTVATYYQPVGDGLQVGGDFYDVFPLAPDRWAFMIGDVCGHGALAATTTGLVRHTARAVARLLQDPTAVVEAINTALLQRSPQHGTGFVTLLYGHLHHTHHTTTIELVRAGHVPPLLRRADGRVEELKTRGRLLGINSDLHLHTRHLHLNPGDSLVMVTDGITEARSATRELFGEQRLLHCLNIADTTLRADAQSVLDAVVHAVGDHTANDTQTVEDDRAALVLTAT